MKLKVFFSLLLAISNAVAEEELESEDNVVTVTKTHFVNSPCIKSLGAQILSNNPESLTTGIPIVFVHEPKTVAANAQQQQQQQQQQQHFTSIITHTNCHTVYKTVTPNKSTSVAPAPHVTQVRDTTFTTSTSTTTLIKTVQCTKDVCKTVAYTTVVPTVYTTTGKETVTLSGGAANDATKSSSQNKNSAAATQASPIPGSASASNPAVSSQLLSSLAGLLGSFSASVTPTASIASTDVETAVTSTSTVFSLTSEPSSTYEPSTSLESLPTTKPAPVTSQSVVSESKSVTIDVSSITDDVTISTEATQLIVANDETVSVSDLSVSNGAAVATSSLAAGAGLEADSESSFVPSATLTVSSYSLTSSFVSTTSLSTVLLTSSFVSSYGNSSVLVSSTMESVSTISTIMAVVSSVPVSASVQESSMISSSSEFSMSSTSSDMEAEETPNIDPEICYSGDLFTAIDTSAPPSIFPRAQLPLALPAGVNNNGKPIQTNKYYANLFLGNQQQMVYAYPYAAYWSKQTYYGFGVQHANASQRVFGSQNTNNEGVPSFYFNPTNNGELIFSATTFGRDSVFMGVTDMSEMAAKVTLSSTSGDTVNNVEIPFVQGMGFVTGIYNGDLVLRLNSLYGFKTLTFENSTALLPNVLKYRATLLNDIDWLIYITLPVADENFKLSVSNVYSLEASKSVDGLIVQVAFAPDQEQDKFYDAAAGMYPVRATVQGSVVCSSAASYQIVYDTQGTSSSGKPIIFALPHHLESLNAEGATGIKISSQTKGEMSGFLTNVLSFTEVIDKKIQFLPYLAGTTTPLVYSTDQLALLAKTANEELAVDITASVKNMNSNYFSGKVIDKYAQILLVVDEIIQDEAVSNATLAEMKKAFETFLNNQQFYPLMYDTKFGGVTSTAAQSGNDGADFGSAYYNDHHFHYGYFIHAAAVVGRIDKKLGGTWAQDNKDWVNSLVRDVANPSSSDTFFPISRSFSWYDGHSWAAGLYASNDGKNQESSSEDIHFAYAMKLWGNVIEDYAMEARGGLMLSIMRRSFNSYFYLKSDNVVQPAAFLPNKVCGIFFENKLDYTTYFGTPNNNPEYVHGIHMLPVTSASSSVRIASYVQEEWNDQVSTFINNVNSGWTGILRLNQAIIDPKVAYAFFSSDTWTNTYLDNGQSRTWSLAFSGAF
ncbi:ACF3 [Candida oxycetoniae]|uniref:glucan endo-1,3-beta-D-glucosidase n=1 Tax=Candida oxycetoniae TaxID=497107 RepID=A0AAI9SW67_9ASCO|nr:ACF3 [Candida oxycetoniae]KAI3403869.2 ACF3 [Candida oxycetoniae]